MNTMDELHGRILRRFHTLCGKLGMTQDEKSALIASYGVQSSADIDTHDLLDLCGTLSRNLDGEYARLDRLRKRAMASIGGWLRGCGMESSAGIIKGIACRATGYDSFNRIPAERLRNLYYTFLNKQKDAREAEAVASIKGALLDHGALGAAMSGSGPTVFGLFRDAAAARRAADALSARYAQTFLARPVKTFRETV